MCGRSGGDPTYRGPGRAVHAVLLGNPASGAQGGAGWRWGFPSLLKVAWPSAPASPGPPPGLSQPQDMGRALPSFHTHTADSPGPRAEHEVSHMGECPLLGTKGAGRVCPPICARRRVTFYDPQGPFPQRGCPRSGPWLANADRSSVLAESHYRPSWDHRWYRGWSSRPLVSSGASLTHVRDPPLRKSAV